MSAAIRGPLRLLPGGGLPGAGSGGRPRGRMRGIARWLPLPIFALALAAAALVSGRSSSEMGAVRALPEEQRRELLSRTVDDLRRLCGDGRAPGLEDHCRELASFAARFDECRGECEALVRRELTPIPTR